MQPAQYAPNGLDIKPLDRFHKQKERATQMQAINMFNKLDRVVLGNERVTQLAEDDQFISDMDRRV